MRITWIDNLKWLGMILILIGHSMFPLGNTIFWYVFSFHVALFFFLSGYLFNEKKHTHFWIFTVDKAKRLLIPYVAFNVIFYVFIDIVKTEHHSALSVTKGMLYGSWLRGNDEIFLLNVSTWFLIALFITSIVYFLLTKWIKNKTIRLVLLILISAGVHYESLHYPQIRLPFSLEPALMATFFYGIWHLYKEKINILVEKINAWYWIWVPILIIIHLQFLNGTNFSTNEYGSNYFHFIWSSLLGICTWIIIAKNLRQNWFLDYFWKNSLIILGLEFLKTRVLGVIAMWSLWYVVFERSYLSGSIQVIGTILVLIPLIYIVNTFFPFILGNFKTKKHVKNSKNHSGASV